MIAEDIVDCIIRDLSGRKGLGDEWDAIEPDIQREIRERWIVTIAPLLLGWKMREDKESNE